MILCDTEIRTYVLRNKGQPAAARKKWDFLDFPVGLPNLRCRKSGTSWVWKLMEALQNMLTTEAQVTKPAGDILGPVVQSIVSLTSWLGVKMLTVLVSTIFLLVSKRYFCWQNVSSFCKCESYSHFFSKNISVYAIFNDQSFNDMLTNNIISFEQLGPEFYFSGKIRHIFHVDCLPDNSYEISYGIFYESEYLRMSPATILNGILMVKWVCLSFDENIEMEYKCKNMITSINPVVTQLVFLPKYTEKKKVRDKSRESHNHKLQPFPDTKRKKKSTNPNKHKSNKTNRLIE